MNPIRKLYCRTFQGVFRALLPILPYRKQKVYDSVACIPEILQAKQKKSVLLVVDGAVYRLGLTQTLEQLLTENHITYAVYQQNTPNPTIDDVDNALATYHRCSAQAIIAIGGGSAMDCAKITGARVVRPGLSVERMEGILKILHPLPLFIAVPTTAGTGSETTIAAVITDAKTHHKYPICDFPLAPAAAVLETEMTLGLPPFVTATTGLDALTHAVEAYIGRSADKLTRQRSEKAVSLIYRYLRRAVQNGQDREARQGMLRAAYLAGGAFSRSYVGYIHGIAHSLGGQYGIAHGLANAVILPQFLEIYGTACERKLGKLARASGVAAQDTSDSSATRAFIDWIYSMNEEFGLPKSFKEIREADISVMAAHADKECNPLYPVPVLMDKAELESVYRKLMEDTHGN